MCHLKVGRSAAWQRALGGCPPLPALGVSCLQCLAGLPEKPQESTREALQSVCKHTSLGVPDPALQHTGCVIQDRQCNHLASLVNWGQQCYLLHRAVSGCTVACKQACLHPNLETL